MTFTSSLFRVLTVALNLCVAGVVYAQSNVSVTGKIIDGKTKQPLEYAAATLTSASDSSTVVGSISNQNGDFKLSGVRLGNYQLKITYLGYKTLWRSINITAETPAIQLGNLVIEPDGVALGEILVKGEKIPVTIKKDTVEFNADAYKTRPDATTEELLRKLPGVEVDRDGNILVQGQRVSRLTVDGKEFFGSDPKTATQNLPADAIEKVQLVDSKTEQAKATGVDDGQREKVLNLTIKKDKKKGWFGNANLAGGTTDRYNGYLSANHFKEDKQFALLAMSNNTNTANFSWEDLRSFSGGDVGSIFAPPGGGGFGINVDRRGNTTITGSGVFDNAGQGLVKTHAGGVNFSDNWGKTKNFRFSANYFTYFSDANQNRIANVQNFNQADVLRTDETNLTMTDNQAHRLNMRIEYKPDTLTDINFRPNVILNNTTTSSNRQFTSAYDAQGQANDGLQKLDRENVSPNFYGALSVLRRLGNKKGSVSFSVNGSYNQLNSNWNNISLLNTYGSSGRVEENINQSADQETSNKSISLNGNFSRNLGKNWTTNLIYTYSKNFNLADLYTLEYNPISDRYDVVVNELTNRFDNQSWFHSEQVGFVFNKKAWNLNFGASLQQSDLRGLSISNNGNTENNIRKSYVNLLPRLAVNYRPKTNRTVQLNYRASVQLPSVNNLQPVQNNTNTLYKREGNPDLEPAENHRVTVNFNTFKPGTDLYWNGYFAYNLAFDAFSNDTKIEKGVQTVKPINVDGNYSINAGSFFGMPSGIKGLRFNFGINTSYSHSLNYINSDKNNTDRFNIGPSAGFNFDLEERLNISVNTGMGYNKVKNSVQAAANNKYYNFDNLFTFSWEVVKNLRIESDLSHYGFAGRADGFNQNYLLWNAGVQHYFYNRRLSLALRGNDILKQNTNISRSVNNAQIEDVTYNNLTRYFSLSFTYRLARVGAGNQRDNPRSIVN